jgi:hypothetical protein
LLSPSEDSVSNFSRLLWQIRTDIRINQPHFALDFLIMHTSVPLPKFYHYSQDGMKCLLCLSWYNKSLFFALHNYLSFYLAYWSEWLDLTCWNHQSWASGLQLSYKLILLIIIKLFIQIRKLSLVKY